MTEKSARQQSLFSLYIYFYTGYLQFNIPLILQQLIARTFVSLRERGDWVPSFTAVIRYVPEAIDTNPALVSTSATCQRDSG